MDKVETIEDFYQKKLNWMPENIKKEIGHFNVFRLDDFAGSGASKPLPYSRRDYFKISLLKGKNTIHYADRTVHSDQYALLFANPMIPYSWTPENGERYGCFCIFTEAFFSQYGSFKEYPVFRPGGDKVFILPPEKLPEIEAIYGRMFTEINSDYAYKYDVLRNLVFELVHSTQKMQPAAGTHHSDSNAYTRIASLFTELLERQFPIESPMQRMLLRTPHDFATQLSVHVNHLNRSLKEVSGKTTSQLITERVSQEARTLLKHTSWNISEIGFCLGFEEPPHFINFFRKNFNQTPKTFRKEATV